MSEIIDIFSLGSITVNDVYYFFFITDTDYCYQELGRGLCNLRYFGRYDVIVLLNLHGDEPNKHNLFRGYDRANERIVPFMDLQPILYYTEFIKEWTLRNKETYGFTYDTETKVFSVKKFARFDDEKYQIPPENQTKWTDQSFILGTVNASEASEA